MNILSESIKDFTDFEKIVSLDGGENTGVNLKVEENKATFLTENSRVVLNCETSEDEIKHYYYTTTNILKGISNLINEPNFVINFNETGTLLKCDSTRVLIASEVVEENIYNKTLNKFEVLKTRLSTNEKIKITPNLDKFLKNVSRNGLGKTSTFIKVFKNTYSFNHQSCCSRMYDSENALDGEDSKFLCVDVLTPLLTFNDDESEYLIESKSLGIFFKRNTIEASFIFPVSNFDDSVTDQVILDNSSQNEFNIRATKGNWLKTIQNNTRFANSIASTLKFSENHNTLVLEASSNGSTVKTAIEDLDFENLQGATELDMSFVTNTFAKLLAMTSDDTVINVLTSDKGYSPQNPESKDICFLVKYDDPTFKLTSMVCKAMIM